MNKNQRKWLVISIRNNNCFGARIGSRTPDWVLKNKIPRSDFSGNLSIDKSRENHVHKLREKWIAELNVNGAGNFLFNSANPVTGIIQIGAHKGEEAQLFYNLVGKNVIWIEAQPKIVDELTKNVKKFGQKAIQALIWKKSGEKKNFYITDNSVSSSVLKPKKHLSRVSIKNKLDLITTSYNDLIKKYPDLKNPIYNFLLLDCQGAEYEVLEGIGKDNLQQFDKIECEISNSEEYHKQKQQPEITKLLDNWGFECVLNCKNDIVHGIAYYSKKSNMVFDIGANIGNWTLKKYATIRTNNCNRCISQYI